MINKKRVKELISELNKLKWSENLDSIYHHLVEIDYLLYKHKEENEYIDKTVHNITRFYWESDYLKKQYIFGLIKATCNILNRYIIGRRGGG